MHFKMFSSFSAMGKGRRQCELRLTTPLQTAKVVFLLFPLAPEVFFLGGGGGDGGNLDPPFFAELAFKISVHPGSSNDEKQLPSEISSSYVFFLLGF